MAIRNKDKPDPCEVEQSQGHKENGDETMRTTLTLACVMSALCVVGVDQKPSGKKTSLSASELQTFAKAVPDVKNAGKLYSAAMSISDNFDRQQMYLKVSAACLIACDKQDVYKKHIKSKLQNVAEFECELKDECTKCSGAGTKEGRCYVCNGKGQCPTCKGAGQTVSVGFDNRNESKRCRKCNGSGQCPKCGSEGSVKQKCMTCAGTGKTFSKAVAARVFRDSCNALADGVGMVASQRDVAMNQGVKVNSEARRTKSQENKDKDIGHSSNNAVAHNRTATAGARPASRRGRRSVNQTSPAAASVKDGFGTETIDGVTYSYKIENGEAMIGVEGKGFTAAVKNEPEGRLVVPSVLGGAPVTKIAFAAFYETKSSEIILPDSVVTIESDAFCNAKASRVVIPSSVRSIAHDALKDSTWYERQKDGPLYLDNVFLGFKGHDSREGSFSVMDGTRVIASGAFSSSYSDFSEVTLPDSVCYIGEEAFRGCEKLTQITIPKHLVSIGNRAFDGCGALVTDLIFSEGIREIGACAFNECSKIESVTLPLSIEIIGSDSFYRCPIKSMTLPPLFATTNNRGNAMHQLPPSLEIVKLIGEWGHIPDNRFSQQRELKEVDLVENIKEIGSGAFEYCEALEEIQVPDAVISIGSSAFSNCKKLRAVKLPSQLKCIRDNLFSHCSSLESVFIPLGVTGIGSYAFYACPSLKKISIPDSVSIIADSAFDKTCRVEKSDKRRAADRLAVGQKEEASFLKSCTADGEMAQVEYYGTSYAIVKNTLGDDNFVVVSGSYNPNDYAYAFMIFPTPESREQWYTAVVKCTEKIKSWIRISAENKVKHVSKEIPVYKAGGSDEVYACVNGITSGKGQSDLLRKGVREPVRLISGQSNSQTIQLVKFIGTVRATDDTFKKYRVSIGMMCGEYFNREIFSKGGTVEEIEKEIVKLLTFVNPESLEHARKVQSKKDDLFN